MHGCLFTDPSAVSPTLWVCVFMHKYSAGGCTAFVGATDTVRDAMAHNVPHAVALLHASGNMAPHAVHVYVCVCLCPMCGS